MVVRAGKPTKEHEELAYMAADGAARVAFHWMPRFADHVLFENPPLGAVDDRTGRLRFNQTLLDLLEAIETQAPGPHSVIVLGTQIFDILKAPMADYESNLGLLVQALEQVSCPTRPRQVATPDCKRLRASALASPSADLCWREAWY